MKLDDAAARLEALGHRDRELTHQREVQRLLRRSQVGVVARVALGAERRLREGRRVALACSAACGHVGAGGSLGFADPVAGLSFGYTMNQMGPGLLMNGRGQSLVDAAYRSLGYTNKDAGTWVK